MFRNAFVVDDRSKNTSRGRITFRDFLDPFFGFLIVDFKTSKPVTGVRSLAFTREKRREKAHQRKKSESEERLLKGMSSELDCNKIHHFE